MESDTLSEGDLCIFTEAITWKQFETFVLIYLNLTFVELQKVKDGNNDID